MSSTARAGLLINPGQHSPFSGEHPCCCPDPGAIPPRALSGSPRSAFKILAQVPAVHYWLDVVVSPPRQSNVIVVCRRSGLEHLRCASRLPSAAAIRSAILTCSNPVSHRHAGEPRFMQFGQVFRTIFRNTSSLAGFPLPVRCQRMQGGPVWIIRSASAGAEGSTRVVSWTVGAKTLRNQCPLVGLGSLSK